jgi:hypothetical protein
MKYRYIGKDCVFASNGDIFEKSKNGYIHNTANDDWIGIPDWLVEDSVAFEEVNQELEEFKENLVVWLEDVIEFDEKTKDGKRALKSVLNHLEE